MYLKNGGNEEEYCNMESVTGFISMLNIKSTLPRAFEITKIMLKKSVYDLLK